jgi:hypothetical protein
MLEDLHTSQSLGALKFTLAVLEETADKAFKVYMTCKTQR